jgi:competence CoiA-like predicted nuclease
MKYRQLTKEQFESLQQEFAHFLGSQSIDVKEWNQIKKEKPNVAEDEMNVFSDVVWDNVLSKTNHVEHFSKTSVNLFKCDDEEIHRIAIKITWDINLLEQKGFEWLMQNPMDNSVEIFKGSKPYKSERNLEIFDLIEKGSSISKGEIFEYFNTMMS